MILTLEQQLIIATTYENAAADKMGVPPQQRAAFARKAKLFRALAQGSPEQAVTVASKEERRQHRFLISAATFIAISLLAATAIRAIMPSALSEVMATPSPWPPAAPGFRTLSATAVPKSLSIFGENIAGMMLMTTPLPQALWDSLRRMEPLAQR